MPSRKVLALTGTLIVVGFVSVLIVLSMYGGVDNYTPRTSDGAVIFQEACARCHGSGGDGEGDGIGPRLIGRQTPASKVVQNLEKGKGRMPRFPNIRGPALENLAAYVEGL